MKVLHIVNWFPNRDQPKEALFIQRQIEALSSQIDESMVIHFQVKIGGLKLEKYQTTDAQHVIFHIPFKQWFVLEIISGVMLSLILCFQRVNRYDILNIHIAYPNLTYWHWIKRWVRSKIVITEHWSAYHFNFNLPKPPPRIQKIFRQRIPVISVSNALASDIKIFSKQDFPNVVVPNVVDEHVFYRQPHVQRVAGRFFMVSQWKSPKNPLLVIRAFSEVLLDAPKSILAIGGYGPLHGDMEQLVDELGIQSSVEWLGTMNSGQIALEMNRSSTYLHCSKYETFSVVCAEALACGCFLIASNVGGIPEMVSRETAILVSDDSICSWKTAMNHAVEPRKLPGINYFTKNKVGKKYVQALQSFL